MNTAVVLRCRLTQSNEDPLEEKVSVRNELDNHCLVDKPRGKDKKITNSSANSFQNKLYRFKSTLKSLLWVKLRKHDILHLPYYKSIVCHRSPPCRKFQLLSKPTPPVFNAGFLFHDPRERLRHHLGFFCFKLWKLVQSYRRHDTTVLNFMCKISEAPL